MPVKNTIASRSAEMAAWRHALHRVPELGYDLPQTTAFVAGKLRDFGCDEVVMGVGRSGIVAVIQGRADGPAIGLRADMDALPITEATGASYASQSAGMMHACGHDGHTTMLLGAAQYLCETRAFAGRAVLIFQPAEEGGAGGLAMVQDGLIPRFGITEVYALHTMPGLPLGQIFLREGAMMAAADFFTIRILGQGGHAATPHICTDPVVIAAQLVMGLQTVVARNADPFLPAVLSVCTLETDSRAQNVIPQTATLGGTARSMDEGMRDLLEVRITALSKATAEGLGGSAEVAYHRGYPVTRNDAGAAAHAADAARAVTGQSETGCTPMMGGEDFSYMLNEVPGAYAFIGNGDSAMLHNPAFDFNDGALAAGASWFATLIEARLPLA